MYTMYIIWIIIDSEPYVSEFLQEDFVKPSSKHMNLIEIRFAVILTVSGGSYLSPVQSYAALKVRNCLIWLSGAEGLNSLSRNLNAKFPDCVRISHGGARERLKTSLAAATRDCAALRGRRVEVADSTTNGPSEELATKIFETTKQGKQTD